MSALHLSVSVAAPLRWLLRSAPRLRRLNSTFALASRPEAALPFKLGQPLHETRPHLLPEPGQLTPGISALEYYNRRLALAMELPVRSAAIVVGNRVQHSAGSVFYPFQQDNNLFYLTGWLEPDSVAVVEKVADKGTDEDVVFHMLVPPKNPARDLWEGDKSGLEGAHEFFNADEVVDVNRADLYLRDIVKRNEFVYWDDKAKPSNTSPTAAAKFALFFDFGTQPKAQNTLRDVLRTSRATVRPLAGLLAQHRLVKSAAEVAVMHRAGQISSRAINTAIAKAGSAAPFATERLLARYLDYAFVRGGCDSQAYIPVVAGGQNALTLHYTRNDDLLYKDETVFVDAGGKLGGYCADISRTWPNSGTFSAPQRDIYEVVLEANKACIAQTSAAAAMSLQDLHELAVMTLTQGLRALPGFGGITRSEVLRELFPHYVGHHLGLDLHDVPSVSRHTRLKPGNVVTIEPGIYVPMAEKWPKHFRGIGVRVEDDVAVAAKNLTNLTSLCVKEVVDIELLIALGTVSTPGVYDEVVEVRI